MAVLTSWSYARLRVRQAKTAQRVRLGAVVTAGTGGVFNLGHAFSHYGRTSERLASPYFAWANFGVPIPFEHDSPVMGSAGCTEPRFTWLPSRRLILTCNDGGSIVSRPSDDDGFSWGAAGSALFSGASHPDVCTSRDGLTLYSAYVAGALRVRRQNPGDASPAVAFSAQDASAVDLSLTDDVFRIVFDARGWGQLHCRLGAGASTSLLQSYDDAGSFAVTSSVVTGISGGTNPGICSAPDGTLYAWARVASGQGRITRRHAGDVDWSTPAAMLDDSATPLLFAAQPFSITGAYEGSGRLVLAAFLFGDAVPCEFWSADGGITWSRIV